MDNSDKRMVEQRQRFTIRIFTLAGAWSDVEAVDFAECIKINDDDVGTVLNDLRDHGVPFVAIQDAKYEMSGEYDWFDGFTERSAEYGAENIVLSEATYRGWLNSAEPIDMAAQLATYFDIGIPPLSELSIAHLPAINPIDTEETE